MANVKWHGPDVQRKVQAEMVRRLNAAAITVQNHARELVSVPGPPPSAPGEAPHKVKGMLRRSIDNEVDAGTLTARVGTNLLYGRFLELGTARLQPRPYLRRALAETSDDVRRILARPIDL